MSISPVPVGHGPNWFVAGGLPKVHSQSAMAFLDVAKNLSPASQRERRGFQFTGPRGVGGLGGTGPASCLRHIWPVLRLSRRRLRQINLPRQAQIRQASAAANLRVRKVEFA